MLFWQPALLLSTYFVITCDSCGKWNDDSENGLKLTYGNVEIETFSSDNTPRTLASGGRARGQQKRGGKRGEEEVVREGKWGGMGKRKGASFWLLIWLCPFMQTSTIQPNLTLSYITLPFPQPDLTPTVPHHTLMVGIVAVRSGAVRIPTQSHLHGRSGHCHLCIGKAFSALLC